MSDKKKTDDVEFQYLYKETSEIADFIMRRDQGKKELVPGMWAIVEGIRNSIDETYNRGDKRGLKLLNKDFKEAMGDLKEKEILELRSILEKIKT